MLIEFSQCKELINICHKIEIRKVFHVGAHEGEEASIYFKNNVTHIIWFEANQDLIPQLKKQIDLIKIDQTIVPCALWDSNASLEFNITNNPQSSSLFKLDKHSDYYPNIFVNEVRNVTTYRLDDLINRTPKLLPWTDFQFLNIDTQGAELNILKGLGKFINSPSLKGIYLEVNSQSLYKGIPMINDIDSYLNHYGFFRVLTKWWNSDGWGDAFYLKERTL
jgi:FkbM family methyltransferase